jgi:hypothetical protein
MAQDYFDPSLGQQNIVLVGGTTLRQIERIIGSCEHCNPEFAGIPLECILDGVTGNGLGLVPLLQFRP